MIHAEEYREVLKKQKTRLLDCHYHEVRQHTSRQSLKRVRLTGKPIAWDSSL